MAAVAKDKMLNPIDPASAQQFLSKLAASDAKHDFASFFMNIFGSFSNIGTSVTPTRTFDEWGSFSNVFNNSAAIQRDLNYIFRGDSDPGKAFRKNVLNIDFQNSDGLSQIGLSSELNADHKYKLRSILFVDNGVNMINSTQLMNFLAGDKNAVYIQQDASFISFGDFFISESNPPGAGAKSFIYVNSREGQNDAAGKTGSDSAVVKKTQSGKTVKVTILEDTNNEDKKYPKYTTDKNSDVYQNFQSIYNITLSPIKQLKGVKVVSLDFYNQSKINATQKGKAENAKGNLKSRLTAFFKNITKPNQNRDSYFTALQQKRSGDWLQALSTYDLSRYNLEGERIILITHDAICAAYGIAMGVDVIFTLQEGKQKWIAYFQNENYLAAPKNKDVKARYEHVKTNIDDFLISLDDNITAYETQRQTIFTNQNAILESINQINIEGITPKDFHDSTDDYCKDILEKYFKYSLLLSIFPEASIFRDKLASLRIEKNAKETILNGLPNTNTPIALPTQKIFRDYENIANSLYNINELLTPYIVARGQGVPIISLQAVQDMRFASKSKDMKDLQTFLQAFSPFNVKELEQVKSKFSLNRFRTKDSQKKNDYGVFSVYLNRLPKDKQDRLVALLKSSKDIFKANMNRLPSGQRNKDKIEKLYKQFELFLNEIDIYFSSADKSPSFQIATTGELLDEMNNIQMDDDKDDEIIEILEGGSRYKNKKQRGGAVEETDSILTNTPFALYLILLLQKRNRLVGGLTAFLGESLGLVGSVGLFYIRSSLSSLIGAGGYIPPHIADWIAFGIPITTGSLITIREGADIARIIAEPSDISTLALRTDAFTRLSNDPYLRQIRYYEGIISAMPGSSTLGGGRFESFDLAFQGWSSLFFHMDTLRKELDDISDPNNGFDFEYFARYTQFLIAMEKSIDISIDFFTKEKVSVGGREMQPLAFTNNEGLDSEVEKLLVAKEKLRNSKNRKIKSVAVVTPLESKRTPIEIDVVGPVKDKELSIGYCSMFTCFGDYANLILTNLLPRIYLDEIWNESLPMLNNALTGNPESQSKWPALVAELCNDNYLNISVDSTLDEFFNGNDYYLRYFLISTCYNLEQMPAVEQTVEAKVALQKELNSSIQRLLKKISHVERSSILFAYRKKANNETIQMSNIDDLEFLIENELLNKEIEKNTQLEGSSNKLAGEGGAHRRSYKKTRKAKNKARKVPRLKSRRRT